jgi:hypothetical protein
MIIGKICGRKRSYLVSRPHSNIFLGSTEENHEEYVRVMYAPVEIRTDALLIN